jgi:hemoglobin
MQQVDQGRGITRRHFGVVAGHLAESLSAASVPGEILTLSNAL